MKNPLFCLRLHRPIQAALGALLAFAALGAACGPPCLKNMPTPAARGAAVAAPAFDLVADQRVGVEQKDRNGILLNPLWQYQRDAGLNPAGNYQLKDARDPQYNCFSGNNWFTDPKCSLQKPHCDLPTNPFRNLICTIGNFTFNGHMNWQPATYEGHLFWDQKATDSDFDFFFYPPQRAGMTLASCTNRQGAIGVEFDSREVVDEIGTIEADKFWWRRFVAAVEAASGTPAQDMLEGKFAVLTGLLGLDCEHGCTAELHPVWALALHAEDNRDDDEWALFARNWGNEGYCSAEQHYLDQLPANRFVLRLPWRPQATAVEVLTARSSYCRNFSAPDVTVTFKTGEAVFVTVNLPAPAQHAFVLGELHLRWSNGQVAPAHPTVPRNPDGRCADLAQTLASRAAATRQPQAGDARREAIINEVRQNPEMWQKYQQELSVRRVPRAAAAPVTPRMICASFNAAQPDTPAPPAPARVQLSNVRPQTPPRDLQDEALCAALGAQAKAVGERVNVANLDKACKQLLKHP